MAQSRRHPVGFAEVLLRDSGIYRLRIEAAEDLLDEGARIVDETGRTTLGGARLLLAVQATRAVHIFESIIALCRIGRGVQASMLNRALLEDALDVHWVAANPTLAPAQADEHERLLVLGERHIEARFGRASALSAAESADLEKLITHFRGFKGSWTRATIGERIDLVKASWGEAAAEQIDYVYEAIQRQNNTLLHPSPLGYGLAMTDGRRQINRVGPDARWREALGHGSFGYYAAVRVLADEFRFDKEEAARRFELCGSLMHTIGDDELNAVSAGSPCPCGSGRVVDDCHRS